MSNAKIMESQKYNMQDKSINKTLVVYDALYHNSVMLCSTVV